VPNWHGLGTVLQQFFNSGLSFLLPKTGDHPVYGSPKASDHPIYGPNEEIAYAKPQWHSN
jgi:hypothetical protein